LQHLDRSGLFSPALAYPQMAAPAKNVNSTTTRRASRGLDIVDGNSELRMKKKRLGH